MADDVVLNAMSGGDTVAADEIAGKKYQRIKLIKGAEGVNDGDISDANPLPVAGVVSVSALPALPAGDNNIGNIDVVSSALPTGAATSAKQDTEAALLSTIAGAVTNPLAIGGSVAVTNFPATQPVSIAASVPVTDGGSSLTVDGSVSITGSVAVTGSFYQATQPVSLASVPSHPVTNAGTFPVQVSSLPALAAGTNNIGDVDVLSLPTLPAGDNNIGNVDIVSMPNVTIANPSLAVTGTFYQATQPVSLASLPALAAGTNNIGDVDVLSLPALPAGANAIGKLAANSGVDIGDVDVTSIAAGSNLIGDVALQGRATGGLSIFRSIDLDETEEEVKGSAGTLYSIDAMNMTNAVLYLKIYDGTASSVTVGTTVPVLTYPLPTNGDTNGCGMVKNIPQGLAFASGITVAVTTGIADNNAGAPAVNACIVNIGYK